MTETAGVVALLDAIRKQKSVIAEHDDALEREEEKIKACEDAVKTIRFNTVRQKVRLAELEKDLQRLLKVTP